MTVRCFPCALVLPLLLTAPALAQDLVGSNFRQATARQRLKIQWENFINNTNAPLAPEAALKLVKKNDPRPVFLWRDCESCPPKDHALLEKTFEDERLTLASAWFHCVRVDMSVVKEEHPLHALLAQGNAGLPHVLFVSADGSERQAWSGKPMAKAMLGLMTRVLTKDYPKAADPALDRWIEMLSKFDGIDTRRLELAKKREKTQDQKKAAALDKELKSLDEQLARLEQEEKGLRELGGIRKPAVVEQAADHDAEGADAVRGTGGKRRSLIDLTNPESKPAKGGDAGGKK